MTLQIPDTISKKIKLTESELLLELGVQLYQRRLLSMRAAAELAGISWVKFEEILSQRNINLQYDLNDLKKDLENLKNI
jgi:predicted HTH domain antitoxin